MSRRIKWAPVLEAVLLLAALGWLLFPSSCRAEEERAVVVHRGPALPLCEPSLAFGTPCLWQAQATPGRLVYPVTLITPGSRDTVTGAIYLNLPPGHEFRHMDWRIVLDAANGEACPEVESNNVTFDGFARYFIECSP